MLEVTLLKCPHIGENIFQNLDVESLQKFSQISKTCRNVCYNSFTYPEKIKQEIMTEIENGSDIPESEIYSFRFQSAFGKFLPKNEFIEIWKKCLECLTENSSTKLLEFLRYSVKNDHLHGKNPLHFAVNLKDNSDIQAWPGF